MKMRLKKVIMFENPEVIINTAMTNVDYCEDQKERM